MGHLQHGEFPQLQRAPSSDRYGSRREQRARFVDGVISTVIRRFAEPSPLRAADDRGNESLTLFPPYTVVRICDLIHQEATRVANQQRALVGDERWLTDGLDVVYKPLARTQTTVHLRRLFPRLSFCSHPEVGECSECVTLSTSWLRSFADDETRAELHAATTQHVMRTCRNRDADAQACRIATSTPDLQIVVFADQCAAAALPNFAHAPKGSERRQKLLVEVLGVHVAANPVADPRWTAMHRSPNTVYLYAANNSTEWKHAAQQQQFSAPGGRPVPFNINKVDVITSCLLDTIVAYARTLPAAERKRTLRVLIRYDATNGELYNKFGVMLESLLLSLGVCAGTVSVCCRSSTLCRTLRFSCVKSLCSTVIVCRFRTLDVLIATNLAGHNHTQYLDAAIFSTLKHWLANHNAHTLPALIRGRLVHVVASV
jgi:hypothetical protein